MKIIKAGSSEPVHRSSHGMSWLYAALCALALGAAVLIARPFAEMGIEDDWSYIRTTEVLAQTGHIVYNGWATAMLGLQFYWGALFVRLFAFSFSTVRASVLVVALLSAVLFYRCLARVGLNHANSVLGTLALVFCPVWFALSFSFMSDVPGVFCILLSFYACLRALESSLDRASAGWLVLASVVGMAGGTCRQTTWLAALVLVPSTAWLLRARRGVRLTALVLWVLSLVFVVASLHWFHAQPYSIPEKVGSAPLRLGSLVNAAVGFVRAGLTLPLFLLAPLLAFVPLFPFRNRRALLAAAGAALLCCLVGGAQYHRGKLLVWLTPYSKNYFSARGFVDVPILVGTRPIVLHTGVRILLTAVSFAAALSFAAFLLRRHRWHGEQRAPAASAIPARTLAVLLGPFCAAYVLLLFPRSAAGGMLDRYLLPLIAFAIMGILLLFQQWVPSRLASPLRALSFSAVLLFAVYDVAAMHDLYALYRARIAAVQEPLAAGVPRSQVEGGFEYDDWTELQIAGHVNDERIEIPAGAYRPPAHSRQAEPCSNEKADLYPDVTPKYILSFDPSACLGRSQFAAVSYRNWLTARPTTIYVLRAGERTQTASAIQTSPTNQTARR